VAFDEATTGPSQADIPYNPLGELIGGTHRSLDHDFDAERACSTRRENRSELPVHSAGAGRATTSQV